MGPLEILWLTVLIFFIFFAFVRGFDKELGVTTLIFVALFLITQFGEPFLPRLINILATRSTGSPLNPRTMQHVLSLAFSLLFAGIIFASYAGETFSFRSAGARGRPHSPPLLDLLVGIMNGYLVAGTLWYFQDVYAYPVADLTGADGTPLILKLPLTPLAETVAGFLPLYVAPPTFWGGMVIVMLIARVRR